MNRHQRRAAAKLELTTSGISGGLPPSVSAEHGGFAGNSDADAHSDRGIALRAEGKIPDAIAAFRAAVQLRPDNAIFHFNLGAMLHECRRFDDAIGCYRQAVRIKPDFAEAYANLGAALRDDQKPAEAVVANLQAIKLNPKFAAAHVNLGAALNDQGKLDEAAAAYRRAIALAPDSELAHGNLGSVLMELGRVPESRAALERALRLAPRNLKHRRYLGELKPYTTSDPRLAVLEQLAKDVAQFSVDDQIELHFALGKAYDDLGQPQKAFAEWRSGNALKRRKIAYDERAELNAFDRIRSVFTFELMQKWQHAGHSSPVPIFIVGMPRSGTTLIEQILASHPDVFGAGELSHLQAAAHQVSAQIGSSAHFPEVTRAMSVSDFRNFGERYAAQIQELAPGAKRIVDKMPGNFRLAGLIHLALPNAAIIHVSRNAADTCLSCFSKLFTAEQNFTYDLGELGRYYHAYEALMAHWRVVLPQGRILEVRYEDVINELPRQAQRIVTHCGLEWDARCLSFYETARPIRTASSVQVRQPLYGSAVGRCRAYKPFLGPLLAELSAGKSNR
jgi:tetratricopeptide (TPR) repeat protein